MNHAKPPPLSFVAFLYVSIMACRPFETSFKGENETKAKKINTVDRGRHSPSSVVLVRLTVLGDFDEPKRVGRF